MSRSNLALEGGTPVRRALLLPGWPGGLLIGDEEKAQVLDVLESQSLYRPYGPHLPSQGGRAGARLRPGDRDAPRPGGDVGDGRPTRRCRWGRSRSSWTSTRASPWTPRPSRRRSRSHKRAPTSWLWPPLSGRVRMSAGRLGGGGLPGFQTPRARGSRNPAPVRGGARRRRGARLPRDAPRPEGCRGPAPFPARRRPPLGRGVI
jgi:hypothetical protein